MLSSCVKDAELNRPKTGSYATKDDLRWKKRILRGVNVNYFQYKNRQLASN